MEVNFTSNQEFYAYLDVLSSNLGETGFSDASVELRAVLHQTSWTTSSEVFGEIKASLLKVKAEHGRRLPPCLLEDINLCIKTIEDAWGKANR